MRTGDFQQWNGTLGSAHPLGSVHFCVKKLESLQLLVFTVHIKSTIFYFRKSCSDILLHLNCIVTQQQRNTDKYTHRHAGQKSRSCLTLIFHYIVFWLAEDIYAVNVHSASHLLIYYEVLWDQQNIWHRHYTSASLLSKLASASSTETISGPLMSSGNEGCISPAGEHRHIDSHRHHPAQTSKVLSTNDVGHDGHLC